MVFLHDCYAFGLEYLYIVQRSRQSGEEKKKPQNTCASQIHDYLENFTNGAVSHFYNRKFSQAINMRTMRTASYNFSYFNQCLKFRA